MAKKWDRKGICPFLSPRRLQACQGHAPASWHKAVSVLHVRREELLMDDEVMMRLNDVAEAAWQGAKEGHVVFVEEKEFVFQSLRWDGRVWGSAMQNGTNRYTQCVGVGQAVQWG